MDDRNFDRITRMLGAGLTRRTGLRAAAAAILGGGAALESAAGDARGNHGHGRADSHGPEAAGPCGNGTPKENRCKTGAECCTGICNKQKHRCRCIQRGKTCTQDRNCCGSMTCTQKKCAQPPKPAKPVRTGYPCGPTDTCAAAEATCTTYVGGDPAGTYCLLPYQAACSASKECDTNDCFSGKCISCSCPGCGGTCTPTVCPTCTYTTVQAAVSAATDGDIIDIAPGTYTETVTVTSSVTLRGCPGGDVIIINAGIDARTIEVASGKDLTLIDVIVDAFYYAGSPSNSGGIYAEGNLTLCRNAVVRNGVRAYSSGKFYAGGGCVHMDRLAPGGLTLTMNDQSVIEGGTAYGSDSNYGGGVFADSYAHIVMNDVSEIRNNQTKQSAGGAGVGLRSSADLIMNDMAKITGNQSVDGGGGVRVYGNGGLAFVVQMNGNSSIANNSADTGGGILVEYGNKDDKDSVQMLDASTITGNTATDRGGGVVIKGTGMTMSGTSSVSGNSAPKAAGIYSQSFNLPVGTYSLRMSGESSISGNIGDTDEGGGGVYLNSGSFLMEGSATITGNTTKANGGGVYMKLYTGTANSILDITESATITGNTAVQGGGVFAVDTAQTVTGSAAITGNTPDNCVGATGC